VPRRYGNANTPARPSALLADLLEQIQMLSPVNRFGGDRHSRIVRSIRGGRPHRGRKDDQRQRKNHREPKCEAIWFLRHVFPSLPRIDAPDVRGRNRKRYVNYFTLARNNPLACLRLRKKTTIGSPTAAFAPRRATGGRSRSPGRATKPARAGGSTRRAAACAPMRPCCATDRTSSSIPATTSMRICGRSG